MGKIAIAAGGPVEYIRVSYCGRDVCMVAAGRAPGGWIRAARGARFQGKAYKEQAKLRFGAYELLSNPFSTLLKEGRPWNL